MSLTIKKNNAYNEVKEFLVSKGVNKVILVCDCPNRFENYISPLKSDFNTAVFSDFSPNPSVEEINRALKLAEEIEPEALIAIGGGSSIDVAKGIKYYSKNTSLLLVAIPTTAGSGSEATRFAVVYEGKEKLSLESDDILPDLVVLDSELIKTLPIIQKKAGLLDALSHSVEAYWSVNSNEESRKYSIQAIRLIIENYESYIQGVEASNQKLLEAADLAGKAINIAKTTAAHAMCYRITKEKNVSHGIAAFMCLPYVCEMLLKKNESLNDELKELAFAFNCKNVSDVVSFMKQLYSEFGFEKLLIKQNELNGYVSSVNVQRLKNAPVEFGRDDIEEIYKKVFVIEG